jgi:hypothetical protein
MIPDIPLSQIHLLSTSGSALPFELLPQPFVFWDSILKVTFARAQDTHAFPPNWLGLQACITTPRI